MCSRCTYAIFIFRRIVLAAKRPMDFECNHEILSRFDHFRWWEIIQYSRTHDWSFPALGCIFPTIYEIDDVLKCLCSLQMWICRNRIVIIVIDLLSLHRSGWARCLAAFALIQTKRWKCVSVDQLSVMYGEPATSLHFMHWLANDEFEFDFFPSFLFVLCFGFLSSARSCLQMRIYDRFVYDMSRLRHSHTYPCTGTDVGAWAVTHTRNALECWK